MPEPNKFRCLHDDAIRRFVETPFHDLLPGNIESLEFHHYRINAGPNHFQPGLYTSEVINTDTDSTVLMCLTDITTLRETLAVIFDAIINEVQQGNPSIPLKPAKYQDPNVWDTSTMLSLE